MTTEEPNPHFVSAESWDDAAGELEFALRRPTRTAGRSPVSIRIHVRDHKLRELPRADRSLEAHYGTFVVSQQGASDPAAAHELAFGRSYGAEPRVVSIGGHAASAYELGPEVPPDDVDGRSPAVLVWADGDVFHLIASTELAVPELADIAASLYD